MSSPSGTNRVRQMQADDVLRFEQSNAQGLTWERRILASDAGRELLELGGTVKGTSSPMRTALNYEELRAALSQGVLVAGQSVFVEGRAAAGDGGQGMGQVVAIGSLTDDGGVTLTGGSFAWMRVAVSAADPRHFEGADETARIQAALDYSAAVGLPLMIAEAYDCGELTAPSGAEIHIVFGPAGALTATAADQTLLSPESHTTVEGGVFTDYMVGFDFDSVEEGARINFRDVRSVDCGLIGTAGGRVDFQAFINCRSTSANAVEEIDIRCCRFQGGDFAICWRGPFERAVVAGNTFDGCERVGVMLGDNGGDQRLFKRIEVSGNRLTNIVSTDSSEYEIHAVLCYGQVVDVTDNHVDTVADIHASTHDSEALYIKAMMGRIERNTVIDGGRGDASITVKGVVTASEFDAISAGTAHSKDVCVCGNTVANRAAWVSTYETQQAGIYADGSRTVVSGNKILGSYSKSILAYGGVEIHFNQIDGNFSNGVLSVVDDDNAAQCDSIRICGNKVTQRSSSGSSAIELRIATSSPIAVPVVDISGNSSQLAGLGDYTSGAEAHILVRVDKLSSGNNSISRLLTKGNQITGKSGQLANGLVLQCDQGSGANTGLVGAWISDSNDGDYLDNAYRIAGASNIQHVRIDGGHMTNVANGLVANFEFLSSARVRGITGNRATEASGVASITSGNTFVTVTMGLQENLRPVSLLGIQVTPHSTLGAASRFWVSNLSGDTFRIVLDADPGATVTFGWRAMNRYHG